MRAMRYSKALIVALGDVTRAYSWFDPVFVLSHQLQPRSVSYFKAYVKKLNIVLAGSNVNLIVRRYLRYINEN